MDVNEYYRLMGQEPESSVWEMPTYNHDSNGKKVPITGPGRKAVQNTENSIFHSPPYNDASGRPIINNDRSMSVSSDSPVYRPSQIQSSGYPVLAPPRKDGIYPNCNFVVSIPGEGSSAGFNKVSGIESELEYEEIEEGGYNGVHCIPKHIKYSRLVLESGGSQSDWLFRWFARVAEKGVILRRTIDIMLVDSSQRPVQRWNVLFALPVKYVGPELNAMSSEVAITRMEFVHKGIKVDRTFLSWLLNR